MSEEKKEATPAVQEVEAKVKTETVKETKPASGSADNMAIGSLVLGVINLCSWCLPLCGVPLAIVGIILGVLGLKSEKNKMIATIGLVLSVLGLIASIVNAIAGVAMSFNDINW